MARSAVVLTGSSWSRVSFKYFTVPSRQEQLKRNLIHLSTIFHVFLYACPFPSLDATISSRFRCPGWHFARVTVHLLAVQLAPRQWVLFTRDSCCEKTLITIIFPWIFSRQVGWLGRDNGRNLNLDVIALGCPFWRDVVEFPFNLSVFVTQTLHSCFVDSLL